MKLKLMQFLHCLHNQFYFILSLDILFSSFPVKGIFDEDESNLNLTICPRHRDAFGLRWRKNRKTCSIPTSWAAHRKPNVKGERGITLGQSRRLYKVSTVIIPVGSSKFLKLLVRNVSTFTLPSPVV